MTGFLKAATAMMLASLIGGCGSIALPGTPDDSAASEIRAGRWRMTATTRSFDLPAASADQTRRYQAAIGQTKSQEHCLSAAEAQLGPRAMAEGFRQGDCDVSHFAADKGRIDGHMACRIAGGGSADMQIGGNYTRDSIAMTLTNELRQASLPGGKARMIMEITASRLGDCPAG